MRQGVFVLRDPKEAGSTMRAIFDGLMMQWLSEKDPEATFDAYRERCERELLHYLLPPVRRERGEAMTENETTPRHCANEACPRAAEAGERYCAECGLERSLFLRERREDPVEIRTNGCGERAGTIESPAAP